ncbi:hypothetical protein ACS0TY_024030 [Phlomoides rotata]
MEQTRMLAHTLAQNNIPKFQNSKFLQFVSKMSRGEITIEDNHFKPAAISNPEDWTTEYEQKYSGGQLWGDQFANEHQSQVPINITLPQPWCRTSRGLQRSKPLLPS